MKLWFFLSAAAGVAVQSAAQNVSIPLQAEVGTPFRVYATSRVPMKMGQPVTAKLIDPVFSFDRVVIPAGAEVRGSVVKLDPAPKLLRIHALLGGDFTPLHYARVQFDSLAFPDGRVLPVHTESSEGLTAIYEEPKPPKKPPKQTPPPGPVTDPTLLQQARQQAKQQINQKIDAQLNARTFGVGSLIRGPNKKERLLDLLISKMPYHPQWYRRGTRFDAVLAEPVELGSAEVPTAALGALGGQPSVSQVARVRFLTTVSSADAGVGDKVEASLSQPLMGPSGALLLPQGTRLSGSVRQARPARWLHRSGRLRFTFDAVDLPAYAHASGETSRKLETAEAHLEAADTDPTAHVKIDSEGGAKATESKTRFIAPAISALIAMKAMDNDAGRQTTAAGAGVGGNAGGLTLGGFSGFGLLGAAVARTSSGVGSALGMWGLAASVYANVVSRGRDVVFARNTEMEVRFGPRPVPEKKK
ncbi:MAG TPA: hypothetical protein VN841_11300 [Bryobacteraceae bacterium]|nr:hypothetical protein [Bryobacteraceae bacterium]